VFSRRIVEWRATTTMTTELVLDTLEMAIWPGARDAIGDWPGLVHHTDAGSQTGLNRWSQHRLVVDPIIGARRVLLLVSSTPVLRADDGLRSRTPTCLGPLPGCPPTGIC